MAQCRRGIHVGKKKPFISSFNRDFLAECRAMQVFLGTRQTYECSVLSTNDRNDILKFCAQRDARIYVHTPHVHNIAHREDAKADRSQSCLETLLRQLEGLPMAAVLHIGNSGPLTNVIRRTNELPLFSHPGMGPQLLMECCAGQGTGLGANWEELRLLREGVDGPLGLCLDTQHLFASGMCDFDGMASVDEMFDNAMEAWGTRPQLIHLNDSKTEFGSRVDRHEGLGLGHIWGSEFGRRDASLRYLLNCCDEYDVDVVTETGMFESDHKYLFP